MPSGREGEWKQQAEGEKHFTKGQMKTNTTGRKIINIKLESNKYHKGSANKELWEFRGRLQLKLPEPLVSHL